MANEVILIVEDNDKNRKLVRDALPFKGYQPSRPKPARTGVRLAREQHPALLLMDVQLPGVSGIEALTHLRADPVTRSISVIAITASVMPQDRQKIMAAGFGGFQGKPVSVKELLETVRQIVEKS